MLMCRTGTTKEKTRYRGKLRTDEKQLKDAVALYNSIIPFGITLRNTRLTLEELAANPPTFPWAMESRNGKPCTSVVADAMANIDVKQLGFWH